MAQLKNTTISDTGSLNLPAGTTAQRPASPAGGQIRYNTTINDTEYYDGGAWRPISDSNPEATGGTVVDTDIGGVPYRIHLFTNTGNSTFTVSKGGEAEYLIVAGGGGGGGYVAGGGGGAGGVLTGVTTVTPQSYTVTVGAGGAASSGTGGSGGNSVAFGSTAVGGGGGGQGWTSQPGLTGGSAGGSAGGDGVSGAAFIAATLGTAGQGNAGGGGRRCSGNSGTGGGGGGAGSAGTTPVCSPRTAGQGGQGIVSAITGTNNFYAGGGGADSYNPTINEIGGLGGGGNSNGFGSKGGQPNSGGGGGSQGALSGISGAGGSGIVVVRYRRNASTTTQSNQTRPSFLPFFYIRDVRPVIARTGLVLELDAANPLSYPGTGTVWTDLSGNGNNGTLINGVAYNSGNFGSLVFDGNDDYVQTPTAIGSELTGNLTFAIWAIRDGNSASSLGGLIGNLWHTEFTGASIYLSNNNTTINVQTADGATRTSYTLTSPVSNLNWTNYVLVNNGGLVSTYVNGILLDSRNRNISPSSTRPVTIGRWAGSFASYSLNGRISNAQTYNRALSAVEVQQNFEALRDRYGVYG